MAACTDVNVQIMDSAINAGETNWFPECGSANPAMKNFRNARRKRGTQIGRGTEIAKRDL